MKHEQILVKCGVPAEIIKAAVASPHTFDFGGFLKLYGPVLLQILTGLLSGVTTTGV